MTTEQANPPDEKRMRPRCASVCRLCGTVLSAGEPAVYERAARRVRCISCSDLPEPARVLNDRRIPRTRANIDHIVVAPSGVWVVDARRYKSRRPTLHVDGGIIRPRVESPRIGGRDGTKLVDGVHKQVTLVRASLDGTGIAIPVHGGLCFLEGDWPMIGGSFAIDGIHVLWPRLLVKRINAVQPQDIDIEALHARIAGCSPVT